MTPSNLLQSLPPCAASIHRCWHYAQVVFPASQIPPSASTSETQFLFSCFSLVDRRPGSFVRFATFPSSSRSVKVKIKKSAAIVSEFNRTDRLETLNVYRTMCSLQAPESAQDFHISLQLRWMQCVSMTRIQGKIVTDSKNIGLR